MNIFAKIIFILVLYFITNSTLAANDRLLLKITSDKNVYCLGEPVIIEARIINMSEDNIKFVLPPESMNIGYKRQEFSDDTINKKMNEAKEKKNKYVNLGLMEAGGVFLDGTIPRDEKLIELKKYELIGYIFELSKLINLEGKGCYDIELDYALGEFQYPDISPYQKLLAPRDKSIYQGHLVSNEIRIEIVDKSH